MGQAESNVTSGVKKQAGTSEQPIYKLVDLKGGGLLVDMMKRAAASKQYAELDHAIKTKVEPFLYNKGKGRLIPVSQLVLLRNCERSRTKLLPLLKNMEDPESEFDINRDGNPGDFQAAPDGVQEDFHDLNKKHRDVCWDLTKRGAVGETCLHLCMLNATSIHADLAKRLLRFYPKLINDIYMCDEYYGENVLHVAIVNEDPAMVKYLLDSGANFHERCVGNFMCPEDQKATRTDSLDHEFVNLSPETNYDGYVYWGEYPLSFAACLGQEECYRLMLARGANPDNQDTNGNTVLHMLVIHNKLNTFDMGYEVGANLSLKNLKQLTPLTLAAKLARVEMFFHIMNIEREIYWQIGSITCAAYPLSQIDTIDNETGNISKNSALNLVVFGDKDEHLELMDGVLVDLLVAKWNTYVKFRFYRQFISFFCYFLISTFCFTLRPGPPTSTSSDGVNATHHNSSTELLNATLTELEKDNLRLFEEFGLLDHGPQLSNFTPNDWTGIPVQENGQQRSLNETSSKTNTLLQVVDDGELSEAETSNNKSNFTREKNSNIVSSINYNNNNTGKESKKIHQKGKYKKDEEVWRREGGIRRGDSGLSKREVAEQDLHDLVKKTSNETQEEDDVSAEIDCRLLSLEETEAKIRVVTEIAMEMGSISYILAALREAKFLGMKMFIENLSTAPSRVMFLGSCCIMQVVPWLRFTCNSESEDMVAVIIMLTTAPYFLFFCRGFKTVGPFVVMIYRMIMGDLLRFVCIYTVFVMGFSQAYYVIFLSFDNPKTPDGVDDSSSNPMQTPVESIMAMFLISLSNFGEYYGAFEKTEHEWVAKLMFVVYMGIVAILLVNMLIAMMGNTYQKIAETRNEWQRQPEDKEEMKDILDMKRVHNRMVQRRKAKGKRNLSFTGSPKHGAKSHFTGPVPPLKSIPPKPSI